jgi:hypothetical protein
MTLPALEEIFFPEHYGYAFVDVGQRVKIFDLPVTGGYTAFIERIACDFQEGTDPPKTASVLELIIDGVTRKFNYEIQINKPYVFDPPIVAVNWIRWYATNNDTKGHWFGVLVDGRFCRPKTS